MKYTANQMRDALETVSSGESIVEAALLYGIPRSTIATWVSLRKRGKLSVHAGGVEYRGKRMEYGPEQVTDITRWTPPPMVTGVAFATDGTPQFKHQPYPEGGFGYEEHTRRHNPEILDRPNIQHTVIDPVPVKELWSRAEVENSRRIERSEERVKFFWKTDDDRPIAISFISDQHICSGNTVDLQRMRADAELIAKTDGMYACLAGDGVDNHIKHVTAMLAARSQPSEQWELFEHYLSIFASKIAVLLSGNHDFWCNQIAGVDMLSRLAKDNKICYAPHEARLYVDHGGHEYKIAVRHQYRFGSQFNQCHTVKRLYEMGEETFDVGVVGHHHEASMECFQRHGMSRWAFRPGSYQISSGYSEQWGFNRSIPTCPTVILYPGSRQILGFEDVQYAATVLNCLRQ